MPQLRLFLLAAALLLAGAGHAESLLIIATSPVPAGKFKAIKEIGARHGFTVEAQFAEQLPADQAETIFAGRDIVIFDAARSHMQEAVKNRLARALPGLKAPHIWMRDNGPLAEGLPKAVGERLHAYYTNGGRANYKGFFKTLAAHRRGQSTPGIAPPFVFPDAAVSHPKAPNSVFATPAEYFRWKGIDPAMRPPTVAIAFHQIYVGAEQTAFIDDLIARIEAGGGLALPYYAGVMGPHAAMLSIDGQLVADAVISTQIVLDPEGRRSELAKLGIPVIQALAYRKGDEAAWRADPQGVPLIDVPFYLAQGEYARIIDAVVTNTTHKSDGETHVMPEQTAAVTGKALNLVRLQRLPNGEKKVAVFFWNYPPGEKNLSASYLNVPRSIVATLKAMQAAGYDTRPDEETVLVNNLQRLLAPFYRDGENDLYRLRTPNFRSRLDSVI